MNAPRTMTASDLSDVVSRMRAGRSVVYYTGHLGETAERNPLVAQLRDMAQRLSIMWMQSPTGQMYAGMGLITLSQRRINDGFDYIATRL